MIESNIVKSSVVLVLLGGQSQESVCNLGIWICSTIQKHHNY